MFWIIRAIDHSYNKVLITSIIVILAFDSCICGTSSGSVKYGNVPISTKLGHTSDYIRNENVKSFATNDDLNTSVVSSLDERNVHGGEVLASKSYPLSSQEPTCEQLRAMWIFSKRQSRAAEMTNEIPTYRDPFAYNIWEPFYTSPRSSGGMHFARFGDRLPVFGRVVSREPMLGQRFSINHYQRHLGEPGNSRIFGSESKPISSNNVALRRPMQSRYGSNASTQNSAVQGSNQHSIAVQGSFQKLKELIWTERAKELTQQRKAEEIAARAAALKEIANGRAHQNYKQYPQNESPLMDENRSPDSFQMRRKEQLNPNLLNEQLQKPDAKFKNNKNTRITPFRLSKNRANDERTAFQFVDPRFTLTNLQMLKDDNDMGPSIFRERNRINLQKVAPDRIFYRNLRQTLKPNFSENKIRRLPLKLFENLQNLDENENAKFNNDLNIIDYSTLNNVFN